MLDSFYFRGTTVVRKEPKNEQALCEAVRDFFEARYSETASDLEPVDTVVRNRRAVECRFKIGKTTFALEHTRIESFHEQIGIGKQFSSLLEPLASKLVGQLPGQFLLSANVGATKVPTAKYVKIRSALSEWILVKAEALDAAEEEDFWEISNCSITTKPPRVPFEVTLERDTRYGSQLITFQKIQGDISSLQRDRILKALNDKCPKLLEEQEKGNKSVLILESDDFALANRREITTAVVTELSTRNDAPDIVIWAKTSTNLWKAWFIKEDSAMHPHIKKAGPFDFANKIRNTI